MTTQATFEIARRLRMSERFLRADQDTLRARQNERLRKVAAAAMETAPYRRLYRSAPIAGLDDLPSLPLMERRYLASFPLKDRQATTPEQLVGFSSSGTTGRPLEIGWSSAEQLEQRLLLKRQWGHQGMPVRPALYEVTFARNRYTTEIQAGDHAVEVSLPYSATWVASEIQRTHPTMIIGIPSLLFEVGRELGSYQLQGLVTAGEVLDLHTRSKLEEMFGVPPRDLYSSAEGGFMAWECVSGNGYHINADSVILEIVDDTGRPVPDGTTGEVVITNLWNHTYPMIRYRTGDLAHLLDSGCDCGIRLPLMGQVQGRHNDWIVTPSGEFISPLRMLLFPVALGWDIAADIERYRIVQRAVDDYLVQIQWRNKCNVDVVARIAPFYERILGAAVRVEVQDVAEIPRAALGKFRVVESHVTKPESHYV